MDIFSGLFTAAPWQRIHGSPPGVVTSCSLMKLCSFFLWDLDKSRDWHCWIAYNLCIFIGSINPFFGSLHVVGSLSKRLLIFTTPQLFVCRFKQPPNFIHVLLRVGNLWNFLMFAQMADQLAKLFVLIPKSNPVFFLPTANYLTCFPIKNLRRFEILKWNIPRSHEPIFFTTRFTTQGCLWWTCAILIQRCRRGAGERHRDSRDFQNALEIEVPADLGETMSRVIVCACWGSYFHDRGTQMNLYMIDSYLGFISQFYLSLIRLCHVFYDFIHPSVHQIGSSSTE